MVARLLTDFFYPSLEFALLERCHVLLRKLEPFAACPTIIAATTPESFNTRQIIGSDGVDQFGLVGQGNGDWLEASFSFVAATDL